MNILAFDTCFNACSVAVLDGRPGAARAVQGEKQLMTTGHAEALMPMMARVMAASGLSFSDIERIAVTHGPGTFTGTRITIATARALALALGVPVVSFSSLWAIGLAASMRVSGGLGTGEAVLVARDARRDECYVEVIGSDGTSLTGPHVMPAMDAARLCPSLRLFVVGSAVQQVAEAGRLIGRAIVPMIDAGTEAEAHNAEPDAATLIGPARHARPLAEPLRPLYLRPPDAKPQDGKSIPHAVVAAIATGPIADLTNGR